jgi:prophage regulatory protein
MNCNDSPDAPLPRFLRLREIVGPKGLIPVSRSTWWAGVRSGRFPKPVRLGARSVGWRESDLRDLAARLGSDR